MTSHRIGARLCRLSPEQLLAFIDEQAPLWSDAAMRVAEAHGLSRLPDLSPKQLVAFVDEQASLWSYDAMSVAEAHAAKVDPQSECVPSEVLLSPDLVTHILSKMLIQEHPVKRTCNTWYGAWGLTLKYRERPRFFVIGGFDNNADSVSSLERYDRSTDEWEEEEAVAPMPRHWPSLVKMAMLDGKLYAVGGDEEDTSSAGRYDLATNAWEEVAQMTPLTREDHAMAALDGKLYVVGGNERGMPVDCVDRYDPVLDAWEEMEPMGTMRQLCGSAVLEGKLYAVGGQTPSVLGPDPFNPTLVYHSRNVLDLSSVERFDPAADAWETVAPMAQARSGHAVAVLDGKLYALGGESGGSRADPTHTFLNSVERYDAAADVWEQVAPMAEARAYLAVAVTQGKLYAVGGCDTHVPVSAPSGRIPGRSLSSVECYDPLLDAWETLAPMSNARSNAYAVVIA